MNALKVKIFAFVLVCFSVMLLPAARLYAQFGLSVSYGTLMDGNTFRNYENISDIIHQPQLTLSYNAASEKGKVQLFYDGSAYIFNEFTARQYTAHYFGITGERRGNDTGPLTAWGIQTGRRINKEEYNYYNYSNTEGYLNFQFDNSENSLWVLGAQVKSRVYSELPEFSNIEASLFARASFFLRTGSTIIARLQAGQKSFLEKAISQETIENIVTTGQGGRGKGNGGMGNSSSTTSRTIQVESPQAGILQFTASLRLAQSLWKNAGLAAEVGLQRTPSGAGRVLSGQDSGYETNDDLYDDPFSYDMEEGLVEFTQLLPWSSRLKLSGNYGIKNYFRPIYDAAGNSIDGTEREDDIVRLWGSLNKTFHIKGFARGVNISLLHMYVSNNSNDAYYHYKTHITSLGFTLMM